MARTPNSYINFINEDFFKKKDFSGGAPLLDMWYDKGHYGRVDQNQNPIILDGMNNLKQLDTTDKQLLAVNFVVEAYNDFRTRYLRAVTFNKINTQTNIKMEAMKAWESFDAHRGPQEQILLEMMASFVTIGRNDKVKSITDFAREFTAFYNEYSNEIPISLSEYTKSSFASPLTSGLMIELAEVDQNDPSFRSQWINDPNFNYYRDTAAYFGFVVDKNSPWRLVADIGSPQMGEYMKKYGIRSATDLFNKYYTRTYTIDVDNLKNMIYSFYDAFIIASPTFTTLEVGKCGKTIKKTEDRMFSSRENFDLKFNNKFWLKTYLQLRLKEEKVNLAQNRFNYILRYAESLEKRLDFDKAISYINSQVQKVASTKADLRFCQNYNECGD